jgi:hypothetical protein
MRLLLILKRSGLSAAGLAFGAYGLLNVDNTLDRRDRVEMAVVFM